MGIRRALKACRPIPSEAWQPRERQRDGNGVDDLAIETVTLLRSGKYEFEEWNGSPVIDGVVCIFL